MPDVQVQLTEFSELINTYTRDFVGREWLVKQVDALLEKPGSRFVILSGGAGVGKSAFMAHLAATHPQWPRYFIRRDSRELLRPSDSKTFFLTIGGQLATIQPKLFKPEKLQIVVRQRIGDLEASGEAVGVHIEELKASPFYSVSILAEQEIQRAAGKATVVQIGRLIPEPRLLTLQDLQYLGLLDPAALLYREDPNARIVVLVDALDELRFSPAEVDILEGLSQLADLPPNLRFIITSRPEKLLDKLLGRSDVQELQLNVLEEDNLKDLRTYALDHLPVIGLEQALAQENRTRNRFIDNLLNKAAGNFLFLQSVLHAMKEALADPMRNEQLSRLLRVEELPNELDALYDYFLDSIVTWVQRSGLGETAWRQYLRPLLGVLSVARQPLNEVQLKAFTGLTSEDLGDLLRQLHQFVEMQEGDETYHIYHKSFADYLLDGQSNTKFRIDGLKWHKTIADCYKTKIKFFKMDNYGLLFLPFHILACYQTSEGRPTCPQELVDLLTNPVFLYQKWRRCGLSAIILDLNIGLALPSQLVQRSRLMLVKHILLAGLVGYNEFPSHPPFLQVDVNEDQLHKVGDNQRSLVWANINDRTFVLSQRFIVTASLEQTFYYLNHWGQRQGWKKLDAVSENEILFQYRDGMQIRRWSQFRFEELAPNQIQVDRWLIMAPEVGSPLGLLLGFTLSWMERMFDDETKQLISEMADSIKR